MNGEPQGTCDVSSAANSGISQYVFLPSVTGNTPTFWKTGAAALLSLLNAKSYTKYGYSRSILSCMSLYLMMWIGVSGYDSIKLGSNIQLSGGATSMPPVPL